METVLLSTKVRTPPQPYHVIRRVRLLDTVERTVTDYKLLLVSAPAGYGKTTLLIQWSHSSRFRTAWVSISEADNDLERFLRYLLTAWEAVQADVKESTLGLLLSATMPEHEAVLSAFINLADTMTDPLVFILDDYHQITDPSIHQALTFLLDYLPPNVHFVVACRAEPPLPLARYRAHGELVELRTKDLQSLQDERATFLHQFPGLKVTSDQVTGWHRQLEGWIAGLQLVALSLQRQAGLSDTSVISGKHRFISDYLNEDVLAHLSDNVRQFLLHTSILESLCGSLCDALTGRTDGQAILEALERDNQFLAALDDSREWFRYHHLFADFLHEELKRHSPNEISELHRRAARWYLDHNLPESAFRHAVAGNDAELAVQLVDRYCNAKLNAGEIRVVQWWVESLPEEWFAAYPVLGLAKVGFLAFTGAFDACMRCIDDVEQRLTPAEDESLRWQLARVSAVRCMLACMHNDLTLAEAYAKEALQALPEDDLNWRPGIYGALGDTYRQHSHWKEAQDCYLNAMAVSNSPALRFMSVHVLGALADLALRQGQLRNAATYWNKALTVFEERETWGRVPLPIIGWVYIRLGEMRYEWNELFDAWVYVSQGLECAELGGDVRALIAGYLIASRLMLAKADVDIAGEYLERVRLLFEQASFPEWVHHFEQVQLSIWLAQDRMQDMSEWVDVMLQQETLEGRQADDERQLVVARALIAKGDAVALNRAVALLKRLIQRVEADGRMGVQLEALALQALANWLLGERSSALPTLELALRLAEPQGYVRLFVDLGLPMARLLQEAHSRMVMTDYVANLIAAYSGDLSLKLPSVQKLPEPLSQREQEILNLLAAGLTNQEIAAALVISPETVKKHTSAIYGKLGVSNRTEAAAKGRALNLLD